MHMYSTALEACGVFLLLLLSSLDRANCSARANYLYAAITDTTNTEKSRRTQVASHRKYNPQAQIKQDGEQLNCYVIDM